MLLDLVIVTTTISLIVLIMVMFRSGSVACNTLVYVMLPERESMNLYLIPNSGQRLDKGRTEKPECASSHAY